MACMELTLARSGVIESQQPPVSPRRGGEKMASSEDDAICDGEAPWDKGRKFASVGRPVDGKGSQQGFSLGRIDGAKLSGLLSVVFWVRTGGGRCRVCRIFPAGVPQAETNGALGSSYPWSPWV